MFSLALSHLPACQAVLGPYLPVWPVLPVPQKAPAMLVIEFASCFLVSVFFAQPSLLPCLKTSAS